MPDETAPVAKRGRKPAAAEKTDKSEKVESKKRARKEVKPASESGDEDSAVPQKRGRGRPKGTTKKKAAPKGKGTGRRGRPKKDESGEDEEDAAEDDEEEEDDE